MHLINKLFILTAIMTVSSLAFAQGTPDPYYDPKPIPDYTLPDALTANDGTKITTSEQWTKIRRPEILNMFAEGVYGVVPPKSDAMTFTVENVKTDARNGKATRKEVVINFNGDPNGPTARMLVYVPNNRPDGKKAPAFMGLNFRGNHTVSDEPDITITDAWVARGLNENGQSVRSADALRGRAVCSWPIDMILDRGYALCTIHCGDIAADDAEQFLKDAAALLPKADLTAPNRSSAITLWAWGLSCALDYLQTDPDIDGSKVAVLGHSRLGKTALWAGAIDSRFALVISNNSGCGGAALYRRPVGETMKHMSHHFPHWFCANLFQYVDKENDLPFDMHELIALQAPRPVYIASSEKDLWADPKGEFLSGCGAASVYELFVENPLGNANPPQMPAVNTPVGGIIHYHVRTGQHNMTDWDWTEYMNMADKYVK